MAAWANTTDKVRDNGYGGGKRSTIRGAILHHGAGTSVLDYVAGYNSRNSHPTYHVASSGRVTGIVHPDRRPYSTAHWVDSIAITFEIDNSSTGGNWPVTDDALDAVIDVIVDHAKQSGYKKFALNDFNRNQEGVEFFIGWHQQYVATACPGPHIIAKLNWIVQECQRRLDGGSKPAPAPTPKPGTLTEDGLMGSGTIMVMQQHIGVERTGKLDRATVRRLQHIFNDAGIRIGGKKLATDGLGLYNNEHGNNPGPYDTTRAFQEYVGAKVVDGILSSPSVAVKLAQKMLNAGTFMKDDSQWIVAAGDTFWKVQEETGVPVVELARLNPKLDPNALPIGQTIRIR